MHGLGDRLQETHNGGTTNFMMDYNMGLTQVLNDGTNNYIYGNGRIAQVNTGTEYFLGDALGSVRQLTNTSGAITYASAYDPYGVTTQTHGASQMAYGYTNEYKSQGLVYLRARMYSPGMGRFLTKDIWKGSVNSPLSLNRWSYVEGNPINLTDPLGLCVNCYVFFFPGAGNYGDANHNGIIDEIGVGEQRVVKEIEYRTQAKVKVVYPYGRGLGGTLPDPVLVDMPFGGPQPVDPRFLTIGGSAVGGNVVPSYKAQEIVATLLGEPNWPCYGAQFDDSMISVTFVGYSGGGQIAYSTAQRLTGTLFVDNLVVFGSPFLAHDGQGNIGNIWEFVSEQDDVVLGSAIVPTIAFTWVNVNSDLYSGDATSCTLFGDDSKPYIHYDSDYSDGGTDYFGTGANFTGQSCSGEHSEQSVSREWAAQLNISRFEANMTMLVGIIEGVAK